MATYLELHSLFSDSDLQDRAEVACIAAAQTIAAEDPVTANHAARVAWARSAWSDPKGTARKLLMAILAANKDAAVTAIQGASDAQIQSNVDAALAVFADGS